VIAAGVDDELLDELVERRLLGAVPSVARRIDALLQTTFPVDPGLP